MTHHRKRHKARRKQRLSEDVLTLLVRLKRHNPGNLGRVYKAVSTQANASGLEILCVGGAIEQIDLTDIRGVMMKPSKHGHEGQGGLTDLESYEAG